MEKIIKTISMFTLILVIGMTGMSFADDFGAAGAETHDEYTIEEMLEYAIEDEYLAKAEYELIIEALDASRPFTNIVEAEKQHIVAVEALYEAYNLELPTINPSEYTVLPESIDAALKTGVTAEINNIAMYEKFLEQDLPDDIRIVFESLKRASEFHLKAFEGNNGRGNTTIRNGFENNSQRNFSNTSKLRGSNQRNTRNINNYCDLY
jgi:hypothetical protein